MTDKPPRRRTSLTTYLWRGLLLLVVLAVLLATFSLPAALAWRAGASWPGAMGLGLFAFPVFPLLWHLFGERRRRKRGAPKGKAPPIGRLAMRVGGTCAAVLLVVGVNCGSGAWSAVEHSTARIRLTAIGSTGLDAPPIAKVHPDVLALVPAGATSLLAFPDPYESIDGFLDEKRDLRNQMVTQWHADCGIDVTELSILAGTSGRDYFAIMRAPGLSLDSLRCATAVGRARLKMPEETEFTETSIRGGVQLTTGKLEKDSVGIFVTDTGAMVVVSAGWMDEMKRHIAGRGDAIHLERFAEPLARIDSLERADAWAVTVNADPLWVDSSWWASLANDKLTAGGTIAVADAAAAALLAQQLRTQIQHGVGELKGVGLEVGNGLGVEVTTDESVVTLALDTDPVAFAWSLWSTGVLQGLGEGLL